MSDRELVDRFLNQKNEEAFRQLYRRHCPRMYALALRMLGGRGADAEDAVQEAWLRAVRRLSGFEWRSALPTWLVSISINCAIEAMRRRSPEPFAELTESSGAAEPPVSRERSIDLDRAVAALPDGYRAAVVLHDIEGFSHAEMAVMLGITEGTSRSQLWHARRALRAALASHRS